MIKQENTDKRMKKEYGSFKRLMFWATLFAVFLMITIPLSYLIEHLSGGFK